MGSAAYTFEHLDTPSWNPATTLWKAQTMWKRIMTLWSAASSPCKIQANSQHQLQPFKWTVLEILVQQSFQMTAELANIWSNVTEGPYSWAHLTQNKEKKLKAILSY